MPCWLCLIVICFSRTVYISYPLYGLLIYTERDYVFNQLLQRYILSNDCFIYYMYRHVILLVAPGCKKTAVHVRVRSGLISREKARMKFTSIGALYGHV